MMPLDRVLRSNLKIKHLQLLVALDQFRHLGRAAEYLAMTQPALSKSLAEIERLFDLPLFLRSTRGTEPTDHGQAVVRFARTVLADYERAQEELAAVTSGAAARVRVGAMVVATPELLTGAVQRLKAASALTTVAVEEGDLTRLLPRLRVGELDLIVARLEPGYAAPDLATEPLYEEAMCIVCRPDHPLAGQAAPGWSELAAQPWVMPPVWASSRVKLNQLFYRAGLRPPTDLIETASFLQTLVFLRERAAMGFVAAAVGRLLQREGLATVLPVATPIELPPVGLITLANRHRTPACEHLMQCLREAAAAREAG
jgi:DNA-binding transcriptional LysR family regulator